jgi:hypothetical protein
VGEVHNAFLAGVAGLIPTTMCFNITTNLWLDAFLAVKGGGVLTMLTVTKTTTTNINLHKIKIKFILLELLQKPGLSFLPNYFLPSNYLFETPLKNQSFNYLHF